jgi:excinuclease UvrABC nuclease subunit
MLEAANNLEFEKAALFRDQIRELKRSVGKAEAPLSPANYRKSKRRNARA